MTYKPEFFSVQEFIPRSVYSVRGASALELMDDRILRTADALRDRYGVTVINSWHWWRADMNHWSGAMRNWSGLRVKGCPHGTAYSQHRFGRAFDAVFRDVTAEEVRADILADPAAFPFISSLEKGTSWLHVDCRNCERIKTYE